MSWPSSSVAAIVVASADRSSAQLRSAPSDVLLEQLCRLLAARQRRLSVTTHRFRQRGYARLGAFFVAVGALLSVLSLDHAAATTTTAEPQVQIGESRSVERSESNVPNNAVTDDSTVAGVAVAGVAIARDAPVAYRLDTDVANRHPNPLALLIGLSAEATMIAWLWNRSRRAVA